LSRTSKSRTHAARRGACTIVVPPGGKLEARDVWISEMRTCQRSGLLRAQNSEDHRERAHRRLRRESKLPAIRNENQLKPVASGANFSGFTRGAQASVSLPSNRFERNSADYAGYELRGLIRRSKRWTGLFRWELREGSLRLLLQARRRRGGVHSAARRRTQPVSRTIGPVTRDRVVVSEDDSGSQRLGWCGIRTLHDKT